MKKDIDDEEMSNTFVADVGQKSAIDKKDDGFISSSEIASDLGKKTVVGNVDFSESDTIKDVEELRKESRNPVPMIIAIIISLAIGIFGTTIYYSFFKANTTKQDKVETTTKESTKKELSPGSLFLKRLIERYDANEYVSSGSKTYERLYSKNLVSTSDFGIDDIQELAILNIPNRYSNQFYANQLQASLDELFGPNIYSPILGDIVVNSCETYVYNANTNSYTKKDDKVCGETEKFKIHRKVVKAEQDDKNIYVNVAIAVETLDESGVNSIYKSYDLENKTGELLDGASVDTFDVETNYSDLYQYRYSFKYDEDNNNYYLDSIEKVSRN